MPMSALARIEAGRFQERTLGRSLYRQDQPLERPLSEYHPLRPLTRNGRPLLMRRRVDNAYLQTGKRDRESDFDG